MSYFQNLAILALVLATPLSLARGSEERGHHGQDESSAYGIPGDVNKPSRIVEVSMREGGWEDAVCARRRDRGERRADSLPAKEPSRLLDYIFWSLACAVTSNAAKAHTSIKLPEAMRGHPLRQRS